MGHIEERLILMETRFTHLERSSSEMQQDLSEIREQMAAMLMSQKRIEDMLNGDGSRLNPGLIERFLAAEKVINWVKNKRVWALGFLAAATIIGGFMWGIGEIVIRIKELKSVVVK